MIKYYAQTALRLSEILGMPVIYNSAEHLYFIEKPIGCALVPAAKKYDAVLRYLKENHPEITL